jgi:hypothetical protein
LSVGLRRLECPDRISKTEANNKYSIAVEIIVGSNDFAVHLIACSCVEIQVSRLKIFVSISRHYRSLISR